MDALDGYVPAIGAASPAGGSRRDDSYRREDNERHRRTRPLGYAPKRESRKAAKPARRRRGVS